MTNNETGDTDGNRQIKIELTLPEGAIREVERVAQYLECSRNQIISRGIVLYGVVVNYLAEGKKLYVADPDADKMQELVLEDPGTLYHYELENFPPDNATQ